MLIRQVPADVTDIDSPATSLTTSATSTIRPLILALEDLPALFEIFLKLSNATTSCQLQHHLHEESALSTFVPSVLHHGAAVMWQLNVAAE